ncbi:outer membrane protein assembly factor BamD [Roseateles sp.]|uniref:outer membrane protein assembly factor BamD n=1 Tax=Roseateles sp. TaxID=1971397 RepID=UPI003BAA5BB6
MFVEKSQAGRATFSALLGAFTVALALGLSGCGSSIKEDPNSQQALDKLYADAKDDLNSGSYDRAIKSLEKIEGRAAGTTMGQQATLDLAWAYYKTAERAQAITTLDRFIKLNPSSPAMDYALYMKGIVNFNEDLGLFGRLANQDVAERDQQASREALLSFRQLVEQYPESKYAAEAQMRVNFITNTLAAYEIHVARYYYNRKAYVAAANRAQTAVAEFQNAPGIEEALFIMGESYDKLGLVQLRDDARRVLDKNFPNSEYASGGGQRQKRWWKIW